MVRLIFFIAALGVAMSAAGTVAAQNPAAPLRAGNPAERARLADALDAFAAAHLDIVQRRSIADGVEYCGLLGRDADGNLAATPARRGSADSCPPDETPAGFEALASYHTHGAYDRDADTEVPSLDDLQADIGEGLDGYIATPGGRLWLNDAAARRSFLLCGPGCLAADPQFRPCPAFPPGDAHDLESLRARADNDTGTC